MKINVKLERGTHRNTEVVFFIFPRADTVISAVRNIKYVRWSQTKVKWYIPRKDFNLALVLKALKEFAFIDYSAIIGFTKKEEVKKESVNNVTFVPSQISERLNKLKQWLAHKRYSESTIKTYLESAKAFLMFVYPKSMQEIDNDDMVDFVNECIIKK